MRTQTKEMSAKDGRAATPRHRTKNDIPEKDRIRLIDLLNARLADSIDLYMQVKQAHWNVKGPQFIALHELFDQVAESVEGGIDDMAERAVALGGTALGTLQIVSKASTMSPYPTNISKGEDHVEALSSALGKAKKDLDAGAEQLKEVLAQIESDRGAMHETLARDRKEARDDFDKKFDEGSDD